MNASLRPSRLAAVLTRGSVLMLGAFVAAAALRLFISPLTRMPFDSDEAILLLMARHILRGERPLFFYGEAYGGSADSYLIALFFRLFGASVAVGRAVQSLEYLVGLCFTYLLARRLMPGARVGPLAVLWLMAVPPLLMTTWTAPAVLYAVVICLGSILHYLGYRLLWEDADRPWRWALFGAVAGLSFWTFGILVVYMLPLFALFLLRFRPRRWPGYLLGAAAFFLFSAPWWAQTVAGLGVVLGRDSIVAIPSLPERVFAFLLLTLPAFLGVRDPWAPGITWPALALGVIVFYLAAALYLILRLQRVVPCLRGAVPQVQSTIPHQPPVEPLGFAMLGLQVLGWLLLYLGTRFSLDATGRYILPLYPVLFVAAGLLLERVARWRVLPAAGLLAALLIFNLATHVRATSTVPPGITAQMNPALQFSNASDQALIDFVAARGGRGYSHHWIGYKIAFLSREEVILAAHLPWRPDLRWNPRDDRYPPYPAAVAASAKRVYVTHREPHLEAYLQAAFAERGISYQIQDVGPYRVYYDLSVDVSPHQLGLAR